jgi:hypothetical protein
MVRRTALARVTAAQDVCVLLIPPKGGLLRVRLQLPYHDWVKRSSTDLTRRSDQVYGAV